MFVVSRTADNQLLGVKFIPSGVYVPLLLPTLVYTLFYLVSSQRILYFVIIRKFNWWNIKITWLNLTWRLQIGAVANFPIKSVLRNFCKVKSIFVVGRKQIKLVNDLTLSGKLSKTITATKYQNYLLYCDGIEVKWSDVKSKSRSILVIKLS